MNYSNLIPTLLNCTFWCSLLGPMYHIVSRLVYVTVFLLTICQAFEVFRNGAEIPQFTFKRFQCYYLWVQFTLFIILFTKFVYSNTYCLILHWQPFLIFCWGCIPFRNDHFCAMFPCSSTVRAFGAMKCEGIDFNNHLKYTFTPCFRYYCCTMAEINEHPLINE